MPFCMWYILVLTWCTGSPLMMTHLRIVGRKQNRVSASVPPFLLFLRFQSVLFLRPQNTPLSLYHRHNRPHIFFFSSCIGSSFLSFSYIWCTQTGWLDHWLYLFVWTADGLACWLVLEIGGLPVPHVVHLFIYPPAHVACLSFCVFCLCHLCVSPAACQDSFFVRIFKKTFPFSPHTSKFVVFYTGSHFLLFILA